MPAPSLPAVAALQAALGQWPSRSAGSRALLVCPASPPQGGASALGAARRALMAPRRKPPLAALMASPDEIEAQFYEALQAADLDRLVGLWVSDELVRCIHPGGPLLVGITAIRASFEALFARGPVAVQPAEVRKLVTDQLVIHQVHERVLVPGPEGEQVAWVLATNAYLKTEQGWRMVLHHASPGQPLESPEVHSGNASVLH